MAERYREAVTTYIASNTPRSQIARQGFFGRVTSLFGWRPSGNLKQTGRSANVTFVKVDPDNPATREFDAKIGSVFKNSPLSDRLEKLFDAWLRDSTNGYEDLQSRQRRISELRFMYFNDPFISRVIQLVADEATQLDIQDRLIAIESPDPRMAARVYQLFDQWGVTQQRTHGVCFDLELLGEAFWANKITPRGVEKIIPLQATQILERLEFNPTKVAEEIRARQGSVMTMVNKDAKIQMLVKEFEDLGNASEDFAEMFETKLFGYVVDNETVIPPWAITHFRADADHSEFYPYGRPHLLAALAPFKQAASTMTLQSLARMLSFPVTLYKVKTQPGMDPNAVWDHVNTVKEEYDNIGVSPTSGQSETYSVNTKIWIPDGLLEVDVKKSEADIDFVQDLEMYIDRVAVASGVPKGYLVQEWGGWGNAGIALVEQFKPFARHVYTIQASFLEGLSNLIRLHFAITGEFDYRTPFTLSMRFPAEEMSSERRQARTESMDLATSVMELLAAAMGLGEDDTLPPEVVKDILSKYSFLDPTDVLKWTKQVGDQVLINKAKGEEEGEEEGGKASFEKGGGGGGGGGGGSSGGGSESGESALDDLESLVSETPEEDTGGLAALPQEESRARKLALKTLREKRLQELSKRYVEIKNSLYFKILVENNIQDFQRRGRHVKVCNSIHYAEEPMFRAVEKFRAFDNGRDSSRTLREIMEQTREEVKNDASTGSRFNFQHIKEAMAREADFREAPEATYLNEEEFTQEITPEGTLEEPEEKLE